MQLCSWEFKASCPRTLGFPYPDEHPSKFETASGMVSGVYNSSTTIPVEILGLAPSLHLPTTAYIPPSPLKLSFGSTSSQGTGTIVSSLVTARLLQLHHLLRPCHAQTHLLYPSKEGYSVTAVVM